MMQKVLGHVAVGINQADPVAEGDKLDDAIPQQGGLARPCFPDDINMVAQLRDLNSKGELLAPAFAGADEKGVVVHGCRFSRHSRPRRRFPV